MKIPTTTITISDLVTHCAASLANEHDQSTATQYAWWLLEALTKKSRALLLAQQTITLSEEQAAILSAWLKALVEDHKPLAYILGHVPFRELTILVEAPTLIPRPETEEWVSDLIDLYQPLANEPLRILDLCTGTGCIALSLAQAFPSAAVVGIDISDEALALAHKNAVLNHLANVTFIHSDLFSGLPPSASFDLIVANPPYIAHEEHDDLALSVTQWEDPRALFAHDDGFALIAAIIDQAPRWLKNNVLIKKYELPNLAIEIGHLQGPKTVTLFANRGFIDVHCRKDSGEKDRVVQGRMEHVVQQTEA